jgi:gas vesicle protein
MRRSTMGEKTGSTVSYFLVGLGVGSMVGIFLAPKSGKETREYLATKGKEGSEYVQKKAREFVDGAEGIVERGKEAVMQQKEQIATAIDVGREAYQRENSKAQTA